MKSEKEIRERIANLECIQEEAEEWAIDGGYDEEEYLDEGDQAELAILK